MLSTPSQLSLFLKIIDESYDDQRQKLEQSNAMAISLLTQKLDYLRKIIPKEVLQMKVSDFLRSQENKNFDFFLSYMQSQSGKSKEGGEGEERGRGREEGGEVEGKGGKEEERGGKKEGIKREEGDMKEEEGITKDDKWNREEESGRKGKENKVKKAKEGKKRGRENEKGMNSYAKIFAVKNSGNKQWKN